MIKTTVISIIALAGVGTSAATAEKVKPNTIEITAGTLVFSFDEDGLSTQVIKKSDYAVRIKTKKGRVIAIRF